MRKLCFEGLRSGRLRSKKCVQNKNNVASAAPHASKQAPKIVIYRRVKFQPIRELVIGKILLFLRRAFLGGPSCQ